MIDINLIVNILQYIDTTLRITVILMFVWTMTVSLYLLSETRQFKREIKMKVKFKKCMYCKEPIKEEELERMGRYGSTCLHKRCVKDYYKKYGKPKGIDLNKYL